MFVVLYYCSNPMAWHSDGIYLSYNCNLVVVGCLSVCALYSYRFKAVMRS